MRVYALYLCLSGISLVKVINKSWVVIKVEYTNSNQLAYFHASAYTKILLYF